MYAESVPLPNEDTHLLWQVDDRLMFRLAPEQQGEILATSCQHCPVGIDLPPLHQHCHITQDALLPLFIQAQEDVGTMHCRLIDIHGSFRLLLRRHSLLRTCGRKVTWRLHFIQVSKNIYCTYLMESFFEGKKNICYSSQWQFFKTNNGQWHNCWCKSQCLSNQQYVSASKVAW